MSVIENLKKLNRQRVTNRRNEKFNNVLSNSFDRDTLSIAELKKTIEPNPSTLLSENTSRRLGVYSTYFGSSNNKTFNQKKLNPLFDHYFISNNKDILKKAQSIGWEPIFIDIEVSTNRVQSAQQSKIPKALPHLFPELNFYKYLLYVDDKIEFNITKIEPLTKIMDTRNSSLMIRKHPSLSKNILNEFAVAMIQPRYQAQRDQTVEYIDRKIKQGLNLKVNHLYWTSVLLRDMQHPDTNLINETWYENIIECGIECQISFDFIAQKFSSISIMPEEIN